MQSAGEQLEGFTALNQVTIPDLWQQQAITALREGKDAVVQAPTGAGKTLIFELWSRQGKNHGQAIYTVPTRALANDKLAEWRARGWNAGIATGDLAENLDAPVIVATLETQKNRLIRGDGPVLLVVDEYQMIGDADRGLNYELALALAPPQTQLLLLSGSVHNPQDIVKWLLRLGRQAVLVRNDFRPVPLEDVHEQTLSWHLPTEIRGYWARLTTKALAEGLGPVLIFAPRRNATETIASELARQVPCPHPLQLTLAQKQLVGDNLARLLKARVAYHHSGLSYAVRAGVIEPLAKAGQLRAVVATMGLAAGINFSLRSVALAGESYRRDMLEQPLRPDEILQMFGRAGRRGIDEQGFVIVTNNGICLRDGYPAQLARSGMVDWNALLGIMAAAADQGRDPFSAAVKVQERLFTTKPVYLGVEQSLKHPETPCQLKTDAERARYVRRLLRQIRNSRGEWENLPGVHDKPLREIVIPEYPETGAPVLRPVLSESAALEKVGHGTLLKIGIDHAGHPLYGRCTNVAEVLPTGQVLLQKWARRMTNWNGRQISRPVWEETARPLVERKLAEQKTQVLGWEENQGQLQARISLEELTLRVPVDSHGMALWHPAEREVLASACLNCELVPVCRLLPTTTGVALLWRRLGLVDPQGVPTRRGRVASFFSQGDGLAVAAALEQESYGLDQLIYDLANLDGGFRFCGEGNRWGGPLAMASQQLYGFQSIPGYLENGVPPGYGAGSEQIVASVHQNPLSKSRWVTPVLGVGDIDRVIIEWRSLLRQIAHAPALEWARWTALQAMAKGILRETESPTATDLPPLDYSQTRRVDHRLILRRH